MKNHILTLFGLAISSLLLIITLSLDIDLFEMFVSSLVHLEEYQIDELIIPIIIFIAFAVLDIQRKYRAKQTQFEKIAIYDAMLTSTHHILNNFLNQMQIFKITAERTPDFDPEIMSMYNEIIKDASLQIEALGSIGNIDAESIHASINPKMIQK